MTTADVTHQLYWTADDIDVDELANLVATVTDPATYPHAVAIEGEIVVFDMATIGADTDLDQVMAEIAHALDDGPGIVAMRNAVERDTLERGTAAFHRMIDRQNAEGHTSGDHFAAVGANDRVWNALEKLAVDEPEVFVDYYESLAVALASRAWLGPGYQVTSQINVVNPGGTAQSPHRDYHLGFMTDEQASRFPTRIHSVSPKLTLQGAIAHVDMPIATGPTLLLPHSQKYPLGYLAWRDPGVVELFDRRHRQHELQAGDALFFNPAVFHAAGSNVTTDVRRMGNLLQISSPFGRAMESVDRARMARSVFSSLCGRADLGWSTDRLDRVIAATAEGYSFPTNLDLDPPVDGLAPPSQADVLREAVAQRWTSDALADALSAHEARRHTA